MQFFTEDFSKTVQIGLLAFLYIFLLARRLASAQPWPESVISSDFLHEAFPIFSPHLTSHSLRICQVLSQSSVLPKFPLFASILQ